MISYLHGTLKRRVDDRVIVDVGGVGYEVYLPHFVMRTMESIPLGDSIDLEIYYHVTDRQLRPTLIGLNNEIEKRFFEKFISVEDIGPLKAARALTVSVSTIARAIEGEDVTALRRLPGIGDRTAKKIVATLRGRVTEEALLQDEGFREAAPASSNGAAVPEIRDYGIEMLVQLGHRRAEAALKVEGALKRNPVIDTPEELIREVYRGELPSA